MKVCTCCGEDKPLTEYHQKGGGKYATRCKKCISDWHKNYYKTNPEYREKRHVQKRDYTLIGRTFTQRYKRFCGCKLCGEREPVALDLHHVNPDEKDFNPSEAAKYSRKKLKAEIRKCVVLCANCHRKVHAGLLSI